MKFDQRGGNVYGNSGGGMRFISYCSMAFILVTFSSMCNAQANSEQALQAFNAQYAELLARHTSVGEKVSMQARMVDYSALSGDPEWAALVQALAEFPIAGLHTQDQKKAFYLNAYNILSMNMVQQHWPLHTLRSLGSMLDPVWAHNAGVVGGENVTLRALENDVLRAMGDPRVHMAINCASMSCPDLRHEPYVSSRLDRQLDDQSVQFLKQDNKGIILNKTDNVLHLSSIFDWFESDFEPYGGVEAFVRHYRPELAKDLILAPDIPYDWRVNGTLNGRDLSRLRADM
ncbi:hypothetical protein MELB17_19996 [Marinobacter sp. ELB17]|nr:hypothetical protein MELB17_19996 [Marinobacter sp. ELB17]